jgi:hypothetical protein
MLKNVVVSFILICLIFAISFAQVEIYDLEGWVKYQNNEPASGVTMSIGKYYIETDENGYYRFILLWPGEPVEPGEPSGHVISIGPPDRSIRPVEVIIKRNHPYQIDNNLNIRNMEGGQLLDNSRSSIAITSGGNNLYQMRRGGTILRYTGRGWEQLDDTPDNYGILFHNNSLYKIRRNGEIWQYTGTAWDPTWERLDPDPTSCYAFFTNFIPERNIVIVRKDFLINW